MNLGRRSGVVGLPDEGSAPVQRSDRRLPSFGKSTFPGRHTPVCCEPAEHQRTNPCWLLHETALQLLSRLVSCPTVSTSEEALRAPQLPSRDQRPRGYLHRRPHM